MRSFPEKKPFSLIVFIHVMKTAGSSVNRFLQHCSPKGQLWLHNHLNSPEAIQKIANESDWISGHFRREEIEPIVNALGRPLEFYSTVREPVRRLFSHLNYSFERFKRKDYYKLHNKHEQMIDFSIIGGCFENKYRMFDLLLKNEDEFFNIQAKMILGKDYNNMSLEAMRKIISTYNFISTEHNIEYMYGGFGFIYNEEEISNIYENKSEKYFDENLINDEEVVEFCKYHCSYDYLVYDMVKEIFKSSGQREKYRPSFTQRITATVENFDEHAYLLANPDVSQAVSEKSIANGLEHFLSYGKDEGRMQFAWTATDYSAGASP